MPFKICMNADAVMKNRPVNVSPAGAKIRIIYLRH